MRVLGVAGIEETEKVEVLVGAVEQVSAVGEVEVVIGRGAGEAIEVRDAVEAKDVVRAMELIEYLKAGKVGGGVGEVKVVGIVAAGARNSTMTTASAVEILAEIQL
jgi:hypothetical protein